MNQVLELRKKDLGNAEEYLTSKGWEFLKAAEPSLEKLGSATFTYNKDEMSALAESFFTYYYSNLWDTKRVIIQVNRNDKYKEYIDAIKGFNCKLISSYIENSSIVKVYQGATTTFIVQSGMSENVYDEESAIWTFFILSNDDYRDLYIDED